MKHERDLFVFAGASTLFGDVYFIEERSRSTLQSFPLGKDFRFDRWRRINNKQVAYLVDKITLFSTTRLFFKMIVR